MAFASVASYGFTGTSVALQRDTLGDTRVILYFGADAHVGLSRAEAMRLAAQITRACGSDADEPQQAAA